MEFSFLKKRARAHRFLCVLTQPEINAVLDKYAIRLRSIQIFNIKEYSEVQDEYYEKVDEIIHEAHEDLKGATRKKLQKRIHERTIVNHTVFYIANGTCF